MVEIKGKESEYLSDSLDLTKFMADIHLSIKDNITSDFVMAKLGDQDKSGVCDFTYNAFFVKRLFELISNKSKIWSFSDEEGWKEEELGDDDKNYIKNKQEIIFETFMNKIFMTVTLNRNVDKNYLLKMLSNYKEEEDSKNKAEEEKENYVKELLKNREEKK